jgi:hypothetical protein
MFKDVAQSFDKYFAAYLGNKPSARPDVAQYFYKEPEELPSLEQFCQAWTAWLEQYHATPKNGEIHGGLSPAAIWDGRKLDKPAWTLEMLKFATLMPEPSLRQVHRGPAISLDKKEYFSEKLWSYLDKKILIKADTEDPERVFAFEVDGRLICECRTRSKIKALAVMDGEESREQIAAGMSRQRKQIINCYTYLKDLTRQEHLVSPAELLLAAPDAEVVKVGERSSVKGGLTASFTT